MGSAQGDRVTGHGGRLGAQRLLRLLGQPRRGLDYRAVRRRVLAAVAWALDDVVLHRADGALLVRTDGAERLERTGLRLGHHRVAVLEDLPTLDGDVGGLDAARAARAARAAGATCATCAPGGRRTGRPAVTVVPARGE